MPAPRQTILTAAALTLMALGGAVYEARIVAQQREQLREMLARHEKLTAELGQVLRQNDEGVRALTTAQQEIAALTPPATEGQSAAESSTAVETRAWLERLQTMKRMFAEHAALGIPELALLSDLEWLRVTKSAQLDTEEQIRKSLAAVRDAAKEQFILPLTFALRKYLTASNGQLPPTPIALAAYFDRPVDASIFQRYEMLRTGDVREMPAAERMRTVIREKAPIDEDYDGRYGLDANAIRMGGGNNARTWIDDPDGYDGMIRRARTEFARTNPGTKPPGLEQLAPYINPPLSPAKLQKLIKLERELAR